MIRDVRIEDTLRLLEIYSYYVENTAISFEYDVPTQAEFSDRIRDITRKYPYIVLEENGKIIGYSYAGPFKTRAAYSRSVEVTIYLDRNACKKGYGRMLYEELEKRLKNIGITNLYACIADPVKEDGTLTRNSEMFHQHMGYTRVGTFHKCGYKFDRLYNMIWMEKIIADKE